MINNSLKILADMNDHVDAMIKECNLYKWRGSSVDAQNYINNNSNKIHKLLYPNVTNFVSRDCVYIGKNKTSTTTIVCIYLTDHLICFHPTEGYATIDILYRSNLNYELIACVPKYKYRTFDNKSVEFLYMNDDDDLLLLDDKYITMGLYAERYGGGEKMELLSSMLSFLDNVGIFFDKTLYIPYIIHPYRLVLLKNNVTKLISCNLLQFILCPFVRDQKLCDVLFIHPITIKNSKANTFGNKAFLKTCTRNILLDFFHSFFVTIVWILLGENKHALVNNRHFCNGLFNNYQIMLDNVNKKKKKLPKEILLQETAALEVDGCKNPFGYCQISEFDENEKKIIHEYGCEKLNLLSVALDLILDREDGENAILQLKELIKKEFSNLHQFTAAFLEII